MNTKSYKPEPAYLNPDGSPTKRLEEKISLICQICIEEDSPIEGYDAIRDAICEIIDNRRDAMNYIVKQIIGKDD